ncbi:MAG: DNA mismatch repair protein MutS [Anaerolineae bacterium]|nr:DNA mismatch repair protein MutS [Anaerolineae bacterium]
MTTPMRRQYLQIKRQYPDAIVLFRLGDFYETFDEDAKIVAQVCDVVLTSRPVGKGHRVPLAGVPYHALETYLAKLIEAGYKVAIAEQVSDQPVRGLVDREVVRVVTPGTVTEPALLDEKRNNYLAAVVMEGTRAGLAYVDITTGEFAATQLEGVGVRDLLAEELSRLDPAEVLVGGASQPERWAGALDGRAALTEVADRYFDLEQAEDALRRQFGVASLEGFGLGGKPLAVRAAGAVLAYLQETQRDTLGRLRTPHTYSTADFMLLDPATRRNLELVETIRGRAVEGSLLGVLDLTRTPMGGRLLRKRLLQPLVDRERLERRLDAVEAFFRDTPLRLELLERLKGLGDLERLTQRVTSGSAGPRDLLGIAKALKAVGPVRAALEKAEAQAEGALADALRRLREGLDPCEEVVGLVEAAIAEDAPPTLAGGRVIRPGFSPELDGIEESARSAREWVAGLQARERERTGIKSLKVGYNKVFGYYLEVTKPNLHLVPEDYVRKQTLTNAERFVTPELKEYEALILHAEERIRELELEIFRSVRAKVAESADRLLATAEALAELDVYVALAEVAHRNRYTRPTLTDEDRIDIVAGRHPVVERTLRDEPFVPNDVHLSPEERILVITGPNMSGKSTYLRQVALIVLLAQVGSFVPADAAKIGLVDRIFTRIGAQDEIHAGQSTFMVEMLETANILHHATSRSLVILDEIGRGTSTYDGISIAWAVVEYLHNHPRLGCKTLFATHYHELTALEELLPRVRNYNVAVAEDGEKVIFLRKIVPGGADRSYGIHVAQLAGLPGPVVRRAQEILQEFEQNSHRGPGLPGPHRPYQLALFSLSDPIADEIAALDITTMTPLEALNKLYELQKAVQERRKRGGGA